MNEEAEEGQVSEIFRGLFTQGCVPRRINVGRLTNREPIARRVCGLLAQSSIAGCQLKHPLSWHVTGACLFATLFQGRLRGADTLVNFFPIRLMYLMGLIVSSSKVYSRDSNFININVQSIL